MFQKIEQQEPCRARGLETLGLNAVITASQKAKASALSATLCTPTGFLGRNSSHIVWKMTRFSSPSCRGGGKIPMLLLFGDALSPSGLEMPRCSPPTPQQLLGAGVKQLDVEFAKYWLSALIIGYFFCSLSFLFFSFFLPGTKLIRPTLPVPQPFTGSRTSVFHREGEFQNYFWD